MRKQKKTLRRKSTRPEVIGTIHVHTKGFGFVSPEDKVKYPQDIFIPKHLKQNAVDGDTVKAAININKRSEKGPEGLVISVIKRAKSEMVGTVWMFDPKGNILLYVPALGTSKSALVKKSKKAKYEVGDRLLLHVKDWGEENKVAECRVLKKIGSINDPQTDIPAAIIDFQLSDDFPKEVVREACSFPREVQEVDCQDREDLTQLECFTIDPDTAKDFDDALSLSQDEKGVYCLGIHIADVSHYVTPGSALDTEARKRCNSTYFPGRCIPMLPEQLSNELCSLKEGVIRLTVSILLKLDKEGNVLDQTIARAFIKSRKRMTYGEAKEVLDGKRKSPHAESLKRMQELCHTLRKKRFVRGSVDLSMPETVILLDDNGAPYDFAVHEYDITHQLVEEYMLKANEIVAEHFVRKKLPSVFRIHEEPARENLEDFYSLARSLGFQLANDPTSEDIQALFDNAKKTPHIQQLSIGFIRSMKLAVYSKENVGHFGLALENYCHFTSPIRRYTDLVIHRLLFDPNLPEDLEGIAKECSDQERRSFKAEMSVVTLKKLRLLKKYKERDPERIYSATVTKVKPFGIHFEVAPVGIEGFLHVSKLTQDYFEFHPNIQALIGQKQQESFRMGDNLELLVEDIDLTLVESKWQLLRKIK